MVLNRRSLENLKRIAPPGRGRVVIQEEKMRVFVRIKPLPDEDDVSKYIFGNGTASPYLEYISYLTRFWHPPSITIILSNYSVSVQVNVTNNNKPLNCLTMVKYKLFPSTISKTTFYPLLPTTAAFKSGRTTLLLSPPGHGKK